MKASRVLGVSDTAVYTWIRAGAPSELNDGKAVCDPEAIARWHEAAAGTGKIKAGTNAMARAAADRRKAAKRAESANHAVAVERRRAPDEAANAFSPGAAAIDPEILEPEVFRPQRRLGSVRVTLDDGESDPLYQAKLAAVRALTKQRETTTEAKQLDLESRREALDAKLNGERVERLVFLRKSLMRLPATLAPLLEGLRTGQIERIVEQELRRMLHEWAATK